MAFGNGVDFVVLAWKSGCLYAIPLFTKTKMKKIYGLKPADFLPTTEEGNPGKKLGLARVGLGSVCRQRILCSLNTPSCLRFACRVCRDAQVERIVLPHRNKQKKIWDK